MILLLGDSKTNVSSHCPSKSYEEVLTGLSQVYSAGFQPHITISRLSPWGSIWEWEKQAGPTFQGPGWG